MRWPALILFVLLLLLQYPLWFGHGGYVQVRESARQLKTLQDANQQLEQRNAGAVAEVKDLKNGYDAIEERARYEIGLIKPKEKFVQVPDAPLNGAGPASSAANP